jgi:hypothetical protein
MPAASVKRGLVFRGLQQEDPSGLDGLDGERGESPACDDVDLQQHLLRYDQMSVVEEEEGRVLVPVGLDELIRRDLDAPTAAPSAFTPYCRLARWMSAHSVETCSSAVSLSQCATAVVPMREEPEYCGEQRADTST